MKRGKCAGGKERRIKGRKEPLNEEWGRKKRWEKEEDETEEKRRERNDGKHKVKEEGGKRKSKEKR